MTAIAPADRSVWLTDQQQIARRNLDTIAQRENAQRKADNQRNDAQKARDQAQKQHSTTQNVLNAAQAAFDKATQTVQTEQQRQADHVRQLAERLSALDPAFSGHDWRPLWQADPVWFHEQRQQKVTQWNEQSRKAEQWQQQTAPGCNRSARRLRRWISHVQEMTERIGVQIQVRRQSGGQSRIEVTGA